MSRRRFFPAQEAQRTLGAKVELEMQMRPEVPAPAKSGGNCEVGGAALFRDTPRIDGPHWSASAQLLQVVYQDWRITAGYCDMPSEWSYPDEQAWRAVLVGPSLSGVDWSWTLEAPPLPNDPDYPPSWWDGMEVEVQDGTLRILVLPGRVQGPNDAPVWAELRATASCGGARAGTIILRVVLWGGNYQFPPIGG
ncbi:hypothetical protein [Ottowia oryzae]|uniref:Uncharacterized protein n=1 Tax=Ottowia oryzae TaxID=2109914 RepID=A0A2S0MD66_9BURK|nr:hypothetical protein [Ottowia oryzae]AVO33701.1 hypothetical protein C6570_05080 [Ottowia oryzae]